MPINRRSFLQFSSLAALCAAMPAVSAESVRPKRILVYGDSNTFGWVYDPKVGVTRLPVKKTWARVMADKLGAGYEVEVNALGGRTICRDQPSGIGSGSRIPGPLFNGMTSLPAVLSENLPLDLVIVMLGTNDAKEAFKTNSRFSLQMILGRMTELIRGDGWGRTHTVSRARRCFSLHRFISRTTPPTEIFLRVPTRLRKHCPKPYAGKPQKSERNI